MPAGSSSPVADRPVAGGRVALAALAIVAAVLIAFSSGFAGTFVFDDQNSILANPSIRSGAGLRAAFMPPPGITTSGRPVANATLALNMRIDRGSLAGFHAVNIAIHAAAALALFGILRRSANGLPATFFAFAAALLWAVHPLQTESVTYIIQRTEALMGLFYLLTLYCFVRGARPGGISGGWGALSVVACVLGMATKEVMVSAPIAVLLYDRALIGGTFGAALRARRGYYAALASSWLLLAWLVADGGGNRDGTFDTARFADWRDFWLTQPTAILTYLRLSFWPHPLIFDYGDLADLPAARIAAEGAVVLALVGAIAWALWRKPVAGLVGAFLLLVLAPTSLMPAAVQKITEHRMYLALAAPLVAAAWLAFRLLPRAGGYVLVAVAVLFAGLTGLRNRVYASEAALWQDVVFRRPENARARYNLGLALLDLNRIPEAIPHFQAAVGGDPGDAAARNNLGTALLKSGRPADAEREFRRALELKPATSEYHYNLGLSLGGQGRLDEAVGAFREAIARDPAAVDPWNTLGTTLDALGRVQDAIGAYREALERRPEAFEPANNLGVALIKAGEFEQAIAWLEKAAAIDPKTSQVHVNLAVAYVRAGRLEPAVARLRRAVEIDPGNADARAKLETLLRK